VRTPSGSSSNRPSPWPALLAYSAAFVLAEVAASSLVLAVAYSRASRDGPPSPSRVFQQAETFALSASGLMSVAIVNACTLLAVASVAARRAGGLRRSLRLGPTRASAAGLAAGIVGLVAVSFASGTIGAGLRMPGTEAMSAIARALAEPKPIRLVLILLTIGLLPAAAEEAFFRGFVQGTLVASLGRWPGIVLTALGFGLIHLNVAQGLEALAAGVFLGWITERFGGVRPAIAAHAVNNLIFVALAAIGMPEVTSRSAQVATVAAGVVSAIASIATLRTRIAIVA
jgi:membrane protease YdiL (CAAX protease family)